MNSIKVPEVAAQLEAMPKDDWIVLDSSGWTIERTVGAVRAVRQRLGLEAAETTGP